MTYPTPVRIVNDNGIGTDTKIIDPATGQNIAVGLRCTKIVIAADDMLTATLTVMPTLNVLTTAQYVATVEYDPTDSATIEKAIEQLQSRLSELRAS